MRGPRAELRAGVAILGALLMTAGRPASSGGPREGAAPQPSGSAAVEGVVTYTGPLLEPIRIFEAGTVRHPIEVDAEGKGLKDVVVWVEGAPRPGADDADAGEPPVMDQQNYEFLPHVLATRAGQTVAFLNSDAANHGVTASSLEAKNRFNVVTPAGGRHEHAFVASRHPVAIGCPIHAAMSAWVYVFDHPYFAVTDDQGRFRLPPVPPGEYTLHARHPDGGMAYRGPLVVGEGGAGDVRIAFDADDLKAKGRGMP